MIRKMYATIIIVCKYTDKLSELKMFKLFYKFYGTMDRKNEKLYIKDTIQKIIRDSK